MEPLTLTLGAAFLMGLAFGAGSCSITCLPFFGPVLVAEAHQRGAWRSVIPFSLGRLTSYAVAAALAGGFGSSLTHWLKGEVVAVALGSATIGVGVLLWRRTGKATCSATAHEQSIQFHKGRRRFTLGLFGLGAALALNPCIPLGSVLVAAAASASAVDGLWLGLGFGAGAVLIPALLFGVVITHLGREVQRHLHQWSRALQRSAASLLIILGTITALGWVAP